MALFIGNDLSFLCLLLLSPRETQTTSGKCFVCKNTCGLVLDTTDLGGGLFLSSFSRNRRTPKGRERKGLARLRGEEDMLFTGMDKDSRSSSSTQVTLQPLEWGLDSKLVTEN